MTFEQWMKKVNKIIEAKVGLSSDDLPDCCYRDWFEDEMTPAEAAMEALSEAGYEE